MISYETPNQTTNDNPNSNYHELEKKMNKYTLHSKTQNFERISKRKAKRLFEETEKQIVICPCKFNPCGPFAFGMTLFRDKEEPGRFDKLVREFTWHNCVYETGYYPAFYLVTEKTIEEAK
jgi:hypothetical protein